MAMQRHGCPTQLEDGIMQLKDDEILDNTIIFRIATDNKVHFYRLVAHSNCHNGCPW
jgi:arylsulfatase A-like enzyme